MAFYGLESINAVLRTTKSNAELTQVQDKMKSIPDLFYNYDANIQKRITNVIGMYPSLPKNSIYKFIRYHPMGQQDIKTVPIMGRIKINDNASGVGDSNKSDSDSIELKNLPNYFKVTAKSIDRQMFENFDSVPQFKISSINAIRRLMSPDVLARFNERGLDTSPVTDDYVRTLAQIVGLDVMSFSALKNISTPRTRIELAQTIFYLMTVDNFAPTRSTEDLKLLWAEIKRVSSQ